MAWREKKRVRMCSGHFHHAQNLELTFPFTILPLTVRLVVSYNHEYYYYCSTTMYTYISYLETKQNARGDGTLIPMHRRPIYIYICTLCMYMQLHHDHSGLCANCGAHQARAVASIRLRQLSPLIFHDCNYKYKCALPCCLRMYAVNMMTIQYRTSK